MARPLRIEFADGYYHVTSRGNQRAQIFLDDADRREWLAIVEQVAEHLGVHYCTISRMIARHEMLDCKT